MGTKPLAGVVCSILFLSSVACSGSNAFSSKLAGISEPSSGSQSASDNSSIQDVGTKTSVYKFYVDHYSSPVQFSGCLNEDNVQGANTELGECTRLATDQRDQSRKTFDGQNFMASVFEGVNFSSSSFRDANLSFVDFTDSNLKLADFRGADLRGAKLSGTNIRMAELTGALFDSSTTLPFSEDSAREFGMILLPSDDSSMIRRMIGQKKPLSEIKKAAGSHIPLKDLFVFDNSWSTNFLLEYPEIESLFVYMASRRVLPSAENFMRILGKDIAFFVYALYPNEQPGQVRSVTTLERVQQSLKKDGFRFLRSQIIEEPSIHLLKVMEQFPMIPLQLEACSGQNLLELAFYVEETELRGQLIDAILKRWDFSISTRERADRFRKGIVPLLNSFTDEQWKSWLALGMRAVSSSPCQENYSSWRYGKRYITDYKTGTFIETWLNHLAYGDSQEQFLPQIPKLWEKSMDSFSGPFPLI